jgi:copper(I)-binding protein
LAAPRGFSRTSWSQIFARGRLATVPAPASPLIFHSFPQRSIHLELRYHRQDTVMHRRTFLIAAAALGAAPQLARAHSFDAGSLHIGRPWTRPTARGQNAAGYLSITNRGAAADALLAVQCSLATHVTLHASSMSGGVMSMRAVASVAIPAGGTASFAPGGLHIMFEGLRAPFTDGAMIPATLRFQRAGAVPVRFRVQVMAPAAGGHDMLGMAH